MAESLPPFRFDPIEGIWAPAPPGEDRAAPTLTCVTWNIWFGRHYFHERGTAILRLLREADADVIALQEVTPAFLRRLLEEPWCRERYALSDAQGTTFTSYGVVMLSRLTPHRLTLHPLPSGLDRKLLVATLLLNGQATTAATVHLESMSISAAERGHQLAIIFPILASAGHALLMGDFNFCASWPEENGRLDPTYRDVWQAVHGEAPGYTEDTDVNRMRLAVQGKRKRVRFDRMLVRSGDPGWQPRSIRLLGTEPIAPDHPNVFPSDHFGLVAKLAWQA
jgi:tyrosyl-DNA phosphodiesterase 2